jgi:hypothetical protein
VTGLPTRAGYVSLHPGGIVSDLFDRRRYKLADLDRLFAQIREEKGGSISCSRMPAPPFPRRAGRYCYPPHKLAHVMTSSQIVEAQKLAREWRAKPEG